MFVGLILVGRVFVFFVLVVVLVCCLLSFLRVCICWLFDCCGLLNLVYWGFGCGGRS